MQGNTIVKKKFMPVLQVIDELLLEQRKQLEAERYNLMLSKRAMMLENNYWMAYLGAV
jgi:hypothetical protein|uniref:Uncharacterized protein n=1 Tax=viral metagenome TaxID=1070528 RepID=A0A6C0I9G5_9ZZZZ